MELGRLCSYQYTRGYEAHCHTSAAAPARSNTLRYSGVK